MVDTPAAAAPAASSPAPSNPLTGMLGSLGDKPKELAGAAQVALLANRIKSDPAKYMQEATRDPEKFRTDVKLLTDNIDNPMVQQALGKGLLESIRKMSDSLPGGQLTGPMIEQLKPRIEEFTKNTQFIEVMKNAAPILDSVLKDQNVQGAVRGAAAPGQQFADMLKGFLPEGMNANGMQDLNSVISMLTAVMTTKLPEMLNQAVGSNNGMTTDGLGSGGTSARSNQPVQGADRGGRS
jgi:hypothetical protein